MHYRPDRAAERFVYGQTRPITSTRPFPFLRIMDLEPGATPHPIGVELQARNAEYKVPFFRTRIPGECNPEAQRQCPPSDIVCWRICSGVAGNGDALAQEDAS